VTISAHTATISAAAGVMHDHQSERQPMAYQHQQKGDAIDRLRQLRQRRVETLSIQRISTVWPPVTRPSPPPGPPGCGCRRRIRLVAAGPRFTGQQRFVSQRAAN
jgi:hypothetical protein